MCIFSSYYARACTRTRTQIFAFVQDKTCYELKNLELKCQYFLQVQAVAVYGGRRLTSRKASKVFNSTDYMAYGKTHTHTHTEIIPIVLVSSSAPFPLGLPSKFVQFVSKSG